MEMNSLMISACLLAVITTVASARNMALVETKLNELDEKLSKKTCGDTHVHIKQGLGVDSKDDTIAPEANEYKYASCKLERNSVYRSHHKVVGKVYFRQKPSSDLEMRISLSGFTGAGLYGFHIHHSATYENGCNSFGGHYNPYGLVHGAPRFHVRHVGDFGNIEADAYGRVEEKRTDWLASLTGEHSVIGRGIVVHEGQDDLGLGSDAGSKATGNAGKRLACCVIGWSTDAIDWP